MFCVLASLYFLCNISVLAAWYLHLIEYIFSQVRELACTSKFASCAGSSLAAGRATHARHILNEMSDKDTQVHHAVDWTFGWHPHLLNTTVMKLWEKPQKKEKDIKVPDTELEGSSKEGRKLGEDQGCCGLETGWRFLKEEVAFIDILVIWVIGDNRIFFSFGFSYWHSVWVYYVWCCAVHKALSDFLWLCMLWIFDCMQQVK